MYLHIVHLTGQAAEGVKEMVLEEKPVAGAGEEEESDDEAIDMEVMPDSSRISLWRISKSNFDRFVSKFDCSGFCWEWQTWRGHRGGGAICRGDKPILCRERIKRAKPKRFEQQKTEILWAGCSGRGDSFDENVRPQHYLRQILPGVFSNHHYPPSLSPAYPKIKTNSSNQFFYDGQ